MSMASRAIIPSADVAYPAVKSTAGLTMQRKCACGNHTIGGAVCDECDEKQRLGLQTKLTINEPGDIYEQEADRIADQVMGMPAHASTEKEPPCIKRFSAQSAGRTDTVPASVDKVLSDPGRPLDPALRQDMEQRFGYNFGEVRVHTDEQAAESAWALEANAYTVGNKMVFGRSQYATQTSRGRWLLAHELTHVMQQNGRSYSASVAQRQFEPGFDPDVAAERAYGSSGAPKAKKCGRPSRCPAGFCDPYGSQQLAEYYRSKDAWWLMAGISVAVDSRVVPLWREYLWGGSSPKDLSTDFGTDFTNSPTTRAKTSVLYDELKKSLAAKPPSVPLYSTSFLDVATLIPQTVAELDDPASPNQMNFNIPKDIPGNLAGGIGKDQLACPAGAKPSPFNDSRKASGTVNVTRLSASELTVTPIISYAVKDTIDLCPGDCGTTLEQVATVPLSQFEATGISGDVPFTVNFPAPFLGQFTVSTPLTTTPSPAPSPNNP